MITNANFSFLSSLFHPNSRIGNIFKWINLIKILRLNFELLAQVHFCFCFWQSKLNKLWSFVSFAKKCYKIKIMLVIIKETERILRLVVDESFPIFHNLMPICTSKKGVILVIKKKYMKSKSLHTKKIPYITELK